MHIMFSEKILPIVKNQHLLLCTLLIWNALAMEVGLGLASYVYVCFVYIANFNCLVL